MTTTTTSSFNESDEDSSSSDVSNSCPFKPEIAAKLTAAFAKATGIDFEFAVDLLNVHEWNIDQALAATYEAKERAQTMITTNSFKIFSWNADLPDNDEDENEDDGPNELIQQKIETMVEILLREQPEIIFIQQIGTFALTLMITSLASIYQDESIQIDPPHNTNYISIFTRKSDVIKSNISIIQHESQWQMLKVEAKFVNSSIHFDLFNVFLDEKSSEELFTFCFDQINRTSNEHFVLSSISSRMSETQWNSRPVDLVDTWESIDKPTETPLNSNSEENEKQQRDDRLFFRSSTKTLMKSIHLEFQGIQCLKTSKHRALQVNFDLQT